MVDRIHHTGGRLNPKTKKLRDAVREHGHTLRSYADEKKRQAPRAERSRWTQANLSRMANGTRPAPMWMVKIIHADLGVPMTKEFWPDLRTLD